MYRMLSSMHRQWQIAWLRAFACVRAICSEFECGRNHTFARYSASVCCN